VGAAFEGRRRKEEEGGFHGNLRRNWRGAQNEFTVGASGLTDYN
jgi:hypothetical protein